MTWRSSPWRKALSPPTAGLRESSGVESECVHLSDSGVSWGSSPADPSMNLGVNSQRRRLTTRPGAEAKVAVSGGKLQRQPDLLVASSALIAHHIINHEADESFIAHQIVRAGNDWSL